MKSVKYANKKLKVYKKLNKCVISYGHYYDSYQNKPLTLKEVATKIGYSTRRTRDLIKMFLNEKPEEFLIHRNENNQNQNHYSKKFKDDFYSEYENYLESCRYGENEEEIILMPWLDFVDELESKWEIMPSVSTIWRWLSEITCSCMARIKTKRKWRQKLEGKVKPQPNIIDILTQSALNYKKIKEPKINRPFGEIWETDGCVHHWHPKHKYKHTVVAIIDSSGYMLSANSEYTETNRSYVKMFKKAFTKHGFPKLIKSDKRTGFCYDGLCNTDLSQCLNEHGITIGCESYGQYKPNIECAWKAVQNRLARYLNKHNIRTDEQFDNFVNNGGFVDWFNATFHRNPNTSINVTREVPEMTVNTMFVRTKNTRVMKGNLIKINNEFYYPINEKGQRIIMSNEKGSIIRIETNFENDQTFLKYRNQRFELKPANPNLDALDICQIKKALENEQEMLILELEQQTRELSFYNNQLKRLIIESGDEDLISKCNLVTH